MSQAQVAVAAGVSQPTVSLIECGGFERTPLRLVRRVAGALGVSLELVSHWRGADLAKLLDERHAAMVREVVRQLTAMGWQIVPEHTFNEWGERGSIDVLAWQPATCALLCLEMKTRVVDLQDLLSKMDRKRRLAPTLARKLGWRPLVVGSVLVLPDETWARNAVERFRPIFAAALPARTADVRRWLKSPDQDLRGIWFLLDITPGNATRRPRGAMRIRPRKPGISKPTPRSGSGSEAGSAPPARGFRGGPAP